MVSAFAWKEALTLPIHSLLPLPSTIHSNAIRNDLQHPNEYIRGSTLRFLCKFREPELLEPLVPTIRSCLEHRHSYVRKNAVLTVHTIYQHNEALIPDAPELIQTFIAAVSASKLLSPAFSLSLPFILPKSLHLSQINRSPI